MLGFLKEINLKTNKSQFKYNLLANVNIRSFMQNSIVVSSSDS